VLHSVMMVFRKETALPFIIIIVFVSDHEGPWKHKINTQEQEHTHRRSDNGVGLYTSWIRDTIELLWFFQQTLNRNLWLCNTVMMVFWNETVTIIIQNIRRTRIVSLSDRQNERIASYVADAQSRHWTKS